MNEIFCFVPSWYAEGEQWHAFPRPWHSREHRMEFDDTVNQIRLFKNAGEHVRLLIPFYMPELRRFLHRQGISDVDIFSVFDRIQEIEDQRTGVFSFKDLHWPEGLDWLYTPFQAEAFLDAQLYAKVEFGDGGHVIYIDRFQNGILDNRVYMDDRGFLSCMEKYREEKKVSRIYYRPDRRWCLREDLLSGKVTVNMHVVQECRQSEYPYMRALISERMEDYLAEIEKNAVIVTAFDSRHNDLLHVHDDKCKKVYSLFSSRNRAEDLLHIQQSDADLIVTDTEYLQREIQEKDLSGNIPVINISPYDARAAMGQSQRIMEQKILCYLGSMLESEWESCVSDLLRYVNSRPHMVLEIGYTLSAASVSVQLLRRWVSTIIAEEKMDHVHLAVNTPQYAENEEAERERANVFIRECRTEKEIITTLRDVRIILDAQAKPDLYLQIAGISAGVPMVLRRESQFVRHGKNGWILKEQEKPEEALDYFLKGLEHWNRALVYSLEMIAGHTNGSLINRWKTQLELQD